MALAMILLDNLASSRPVADAEGREYVTVTAAATDRGR
jgi:hypothetical protein